MSADFWRNGDLSTFLQGDVENALKEVDKLSTALVMTDDPAALISEIVSRHARLSVTPRWADLKYGKARETQVHINDVGRNIAVNGLAVDIQLPIVGDTTILKYQASTWSPSPIAWKIGSKELTLTVEGRDLDANIVRGVLENSRDLLTKAIGWANEDLMKSHSLMAGGVNEKLQTRRQKLERAAKLDRELDLS